MPWPAPSCEHKAADTPLGWPWCPRGVPGQLTNAPSPWGGDSNFTERLFWGSDAGSLQSVPLQAAATGLMFSASFGRYFFVTWLIFLPFSSCVCICTGPGFKLFISRNICHMKSLCWQGLSGNIYTEIDLSPANS